MNLVTTMLINIINNPKNNLVDRYIASYIIANYETISELSLKQLAQKADVSVSQISRFVRMIKMESYFEFKESLTCHGSQERHTMLQRGNFECRTYKEAVISEIEYFHEHFDTGQLDDLINDLHHYPNVAIFGLLNSDNAAKELQYNLLSQEKICVSYTSFYDQLDYFKEATEDTLIIIFSLSGDYVLNHGYARFYQIYNRFNETSAKVWIITKNSLVKRVGFIDNVIVVPVQMHLYNYTLQCIADLIFMKFMDSSIR